MPSVSIAIQPDVFDRFSDLNFKPSQAIAEFIDNAIQSYLDYKNNSTFYTPGYKLIIDINIDWEESSDRKTYARSIIIKDNAAGIVQSKYARAFETGHRPAFNEGLNEYGMGMKTAAYWLSQQWTIVSKSFSENVERTLSFDLDDIVKNKRTTLEFSEKQIFDNSSYTIVKLEKLHQKNNFTKRMLPGIINELSSIYRAFLRRGEIQINVNDEALEFVSPKILTAPYYATPNGPDLEWKCQISSNMFGKQIEGFIGVLDEMSEKHSGLVIMRRGRVIVGESRDHLYHPVCVFSSSQNSHRYKRLYGEIEIKGFSASFNKNGFSNIDELELMLELLVPTLDVQGHSIIKQASNLRVRPPKNPTVETNKSVIWKFANGLPDKIETYRVNELLNIPSNPKRDGFEFIGWNPQPKFTVDADEIYTAQWKVKQEENEVSIKWVLNNGKPDITTKQRVGEKLSIPGSPVRLGFIFTGWYPNPENIVSKKGIKYSAQWSPVVQEETESVIATKEHVFNGEKRHFNLVRDNSIKTLLKIDMEDFDNGVVKCCINTNLLPLVDKSISNSDVKTLLLSLSVGMFEAQMNDEDTCEGLIKYMK